MPLPPLPASWGEILGGATRAPSYDALSRFVEVERQRTAVYPPEGLTFAALEATPPEKVRVVLLGQDPYHGAGQAHGLCFSVPRGVRVPPSLRNLVRELETDLGVRSPAHGDLSAWATVGVLLLNTVLTVPEGQAGAHAGKGWEPFTDAVLAAIPEPVVFLLLGAHARRKAATIASKHRLIEAAHPSPLSARAFLGSKPFSRVQAALASLGGPEIDFSRPE